MFSYFGVRRSIIVLDLENQPGSGSRASGFTGGRLTTKYDNKKDGFLNYLEYSFNEIFINFSSFEVQNRIHNTKKIAFREATLLTVMH